MIELVVLLVLAFAAYRITRLLVIDAIFDGPRDKMQDWIVSRLRFTKFWDKIHYGLTCTWCSGVWISAAVYGIYKAEWPWDFGRLGWLSVAAIAGVQGMIHALEPEDA